MNPIESQVISEESTRLESMGIPYDHIHCSDGRPVVTVSEDVLRTIMSLRDQGQPITGLFISYNGKEWLASKMDESGEVHHKKGLTECKAYRWVLGYPIGHYVRTSYYIGGPQFKTTRKRSRKASRV